MQGLHSAATVLRTTLQKYAATIEQAKPFEIDVRVSGPIGEHERNPHATITYRLTCPEIVTNLETGARCAICAAARVLKVHDREGITL